MDPHRSLRLVIDLLGGPVAVARRFDLRSYQAVQDWLRSGLPPKYAPLLERECNAAVTAEQLAPHVKWARVKDQNWPHREGRPCQDHVKEPA